MRYRVLKFEYLFLWASVWLCSNSIVFAEITNDIDQDYQDFIQSRSNVFASIPVNHITPQFRKVSLAVDTKIISDEATNYKLEGFGSETLNLSGYVASPYIALSLNTIGIGITTEVGEKKLEYKRVTTYNGDLYEESQVNYSGMGVYLYYVPAKKGSKWKWTVLAGSKMLNAKHSSEQGTSKDSTFKNSSVKYTILKSNFGVNLRYQLSKSFGILPWVDLMVVNTSALDDSSEVKDTRRHADSDLFWRDRPDLLYGLDIVILWKRLEFHLGGLLSMLNSESAIRTETYDIDTSGSLSLSVSYDFKE